MNKNDNYFYSKWQLGNSFFQPNEAKTLGLKDFKVKMWFRGFSYLFIRFYCLLRLNDLSKNSFWLQKQHLLSLQIYFCSPAKQKRQGKMGIKNVLIISHLLLCILRSQYIDLDSKLLPINLLPEFLLKVHKFFHSY